MSTVLPPESIPLPPDTRLTDWSLPALHVDSSETTEDAMTFSDCESEDVGLGSMSRDPAAGKSLRPRGNESRMQGSGTIGDQADQAVMRAFFSSQSDSDGSSGIQLAKPTPGVYGKPNANRPSSRKNRQNAGAAAAAANHHYLRRASVQELPSYPYPGLSNPEAAGAAAASLAHSSANPFELWKPDPTSAAGAAASLAHANSRAVGVRKPSPDSPSSRAAAHALGVHTSTTSESDKQWSLGGAVGAMRSGRSRSGSAPLAPLIFPEGKEAMSSSNALAAATMAHGPPQRSGSVSSGTSTPTFGSVIRGVCEKPEGVSQEEHDKRKSDILRAATISMMKNTRPEYHPINYQDRSQWQAPLYTPNLHEAARRTAARRLEREFPSGKPSTNMGIRGAQAASRRRFYSANLKSPSSADRTNAYQIEAEMALLESNIAKADSKKRGEDAILLMTRAQQNVNSRLIAQDQQISESRGLVHRSDWQSRATKLAQANSDRRLQEPHSGEVAIGNGCYMTQEAIDAIAQRHVQPVIDDIDKRVYGQRKKIEEDSARAEEQRLEAERERESRGFRLAMEREAAADLKKANAIERDEEKRRIANQKELRKAEKQRKRTETGGEGSMESPTGFSSGGEESTSPKGFKGFITKIRNRRQSRNLSQSEPSSPNTASRGVETEDHADLDNDPHILTQSEGENSLRDISMVSAAPIARTRMCLDSESEVSTVSPLGSSSPNHLFSRGRGELGSSNENFYEASERFDFGDETTRPTNEHRERNSSGGSRGSLVSKFKENM